MKDNTTNVIASSPNINGNIGSCTVNSTDVQHGEFMLNTIAINSCNGDVVSNTTYLAPGWIFIPIVIAVFLTIFIKNI